MTSPSVVARALRGKRGVLGPLGAVLIAGVSDRRRHFGLASPWLLAAVGVALLAFAPTAYRARQTQPLPRHDVVVISGLDLA
jgi:hypothetical protein